MYQIKLIYRVEHSDGNRLLSFFSNETIYFLIHQPMHLGIPYKKDINLFVSKPKLFSSLAGILTLI